MDHFKNPYRPGAGTTPPALIGRDDLIGDFGVTMRRALSRRPGKSLMPIGLRGVGKTVLLNRFSDVASREGLSVGFIEAPETGDFGTLLAARLRKILMELDRGPVSAAVAKALRVLKSFSLQLPDGVSLRIDTDPLAGQADSGLLADDVTDLLIAVGEAAASRESGVVVAIDEVQYLTDEAFAAAIVAIHRATQLNLPVVLVGAGLPQLPGLAGDAKSYAERLFEFPEIGSLAPDEARAALQVPAEQEGVSITDEALDQLVHTSHGYPYFLQEWVTTHGTTPPPLQSRRLTLRK